MEDARSGDPDRARLVRGGAGVVPDQLDPGEPALHPHSEQVQKDLLPREPGAGAAHRRRGLMSWVRAVSALREQRLPGVLVTVVSVRGHAPRDAGASMVVGPERTWGSVGGGNLEATVLDRARALLASGSAAAGAEPSSSCTNEPAPTTAAVLRG